MYKRPAASNVSSLRRTRGRVGWLGTGSRGGLACVLVELVLHLRSARNLDDRVHDLWCSLANRQIVPALALSGQLNLIATLCYYVQADGKARLAARTTGGMLSS